MALSQTYVALDIESIRGHETLSDASSQTQDAWASLSSRRWPEKTPDESYLEFAGLFPEFGKICCISCMVKGQEPKSFVLDKSVMEFEREKTMLVEFATWLLELGPFILVGHNIKKFDLPFINIRCVANGLKLFEGFRLYGTKPWESKHIDTLEIWTNGVFGHNQSASLESVCNVLGIESPKAEFSGAQVSSVYYSGDEDAMSKISKYCERDVVATALAFSVMSKLGMA